MLLGTRITCFISRAMIMLSEPLQHEVVRLFLGVMTALSEYGISSPENVNGSSVGIPRKVR